MEIICPLCNGLTTLETRCSHCGGRMGNKGRVQDFYDSYSPYLEMEIRDGLWGNRSGQCCHLYTCNQCGREQEITVIEQKI